MISNFVFADYGWLRFIDSSEDTRIFFKPGKRQDGYFTNVHIVSQVKQAMMIVCRDYLKNTHIFVFNNMTIHTK